jgi:hypothetical protein
VGFRFADVANIFTAAHPDRASPLIEHLSTNYRTHDGIVACAANVVGLLVSFFPTSVDRLRSVEKGHFIGPPPALLPDTDPAVVVETMLDADDIGLMEFGANQVVLVRSEETKQRLPLELRQGLVLTIEESKGLEFDDTCLFNFCTDSPAEREWRVLNGHALAADQSPVARSETFDEMRHQLLREELKQLCAELKAANRLASYRLASYAPRALRIHRVCD